MLEVKGLLYGVNSYGSIGSNSPDGPPEGNGNVYSLSPSGDYNVVYAFEGGAQGANPVGGLLYASDGFLYGTTASQIFRVRPNGSSYSVVNTVPLGTLSEDPILQGSDGELYGVLSGYSDKSGAFGAIFSLDLGLPAPSPSIAYLEPAQASIGSSVLIRGTQLLGLTGVSFNGVPATEIKGIGPFYSKAVIPSGATSGPVTVTTPSGSATSKQILVIQ